MSEAKHTPAPWTAFYKPKYDEWHVSLPMSDSGMKLALAPDGIQSENREADAHLIAAAPDMLAALRSARSTLDRLYEGFLHNSEAGCEAWDDASGFEVGRQLDAVIAKAEGLQP
jgi:hypothetical protein